ncbi:MAG TPA: amino acid permease [Polyangiaceae bacterium]
MVGRRDAGLVRAMGPWVLAASIVNVVVGGGIFAVPSALSAAAGPYAPLVFLVCAIVVGCVAICFAEAGSRVPTSGGPYGTIEAAFGPLAGYTSGTLLWVSDVLACGGITAALADTATASVPDAARGPAHVAVVFLVIGAIATVNLTGVARAARIVSVATAVKLVPLAVFVLAGVAAVRAPLLTEPVAPGNGDFGRALMLALFTFTGMECALGASGEAAQPSRTIPRALAISMCSVTLLFVAVQVIAQGLMGASLAQSPAPLADAMASLHPALRVLMLAGAAVSMLGWIGSDILGSPRIVFALARDGWLPRRLAAVHPRTHVPHVAIVCYAGVAVVLALSGTFAELAVLAALAMVPIYVGGCAAAWTLRRRGVALAGAPLGFRGLGAAALIGIAGTLAIGALASRVEMAGLMALLAVCASTYVLLSPRAARLRAAAQDET